MPTGAHPVWTRRRFLGHLGAVGGSSLVMTAMTSWDLMAGQAGVRPALTGRPEKAKVLILGAGVSGLVVGYELGKLGYDFRILEARDRVGGLTWTVRRGIGAHRDRRRTPGLHLRRGTARQRRRLAHSVHAHRRPELLQGARRPAADLPQRSRRLVLLLRGHDRGLAVQHARAAARGEGRPDRPHQRAARQGDRSAAARSAADGRGPAAAGQLSRGTGLSRFVRSRLQGVRRTADPGTPYEFSALAAIRLRQSAAIDSGARRHDGGADVPSGRRHGPVRRRASSARSAATASPSTPRCRPCIRATPA